jgi:outer membrane protein assembly factor BamB
VRSLLALILAGLASAAAAQPRLAAETIGRWPAPEANQGVAADGRHFYAVGNSVIAKYDRRTGRKLSEWTGDPARFPHLNSCAVIGRELVCAASNYPALPMTSSVEVFDPARMTHLRSVALGPDQPGSLTWVDRRDGAWWAAFANYDGRGGEPARDHRYTTLVKFDDQWRRLEAWSFPPEVLARFAPRSTSGGAWGADGRLYVTGHDHPEVYVLSLPKGGAVLEHLATIEAPMEGQAVAFDPSAPGVLFGIRRQAREVVAARLPPVTAAAQ